MTVKTKITFFIVGAGFISSVLFSVVLFYELIEQPFHFLDDILKEEAYEIVSTFSKKQGTPDLRGPKFDFQTIDRFWVVVYEQGTHKTLFRSALAKWVTLPPVKPGSSAIVRAVIPTMRIKADHADSQKVTFRVRSCSIAMNGQVFIVQIARAMDELEEEIWELVRGIASGLVFSTLVLIAISRFTARRILQPIGRMKNLAQDISERNLDERIPHGEGRDEFSELARTINRMLDRLQYSFEKQRDFLFDTSHELKTPLTTIRLAVDEICANDSGDAPPSLRDNLLRLNNQVLRMEKLVKDLLNLSSLETMTAVDSKTVQISELVSSLAEEYRFLADARNIKMDIRIPNGLVVQGDREKLYRAFSNILDNAVKYNVDGGRIELTVEQLPNGVTVTVANTGPGVSEAEIPKVFDQFYRVEKSRSTQHGGFGLGLAIVKRIIELHGGDVTFESRVGAWTRVIATLPINRKTALI